LIGLSKQNITKHTTKNNKATTKNTHTNKQKQKQNKTKTKQNKKVMKATCFFSSNYGDNMLIQMTDPLF